MRHFYALISFGFCLFVALTVIMEFYKGARSIGAKNHMNLLRATVELTHRNTRRYGATWSTWGGADFHRRHRPRLQPE